MGYKGGQRNTYHHTSLINIDSAADAKAAEWYCGKKVAYIYKAAKSVNNTKYRVVWGKVMRPHGNNGVVRCKFKTNLSPESMGESVRIMLYPSRV